MNKNIIYLFCIILLWGGRLACSQDVRKPDETFELVVKSTYPARIRAAVAKDSNVYVWFEYQDIRVDGGRTWTGYAAQKFQIYERTKLIKEITNLKDIPQYELAAISADVQMTSTVTWSPHGGGGSEYDNKITLAGMTELGLSKNLIILGPFDYEVLWVRPMGQDKNGFLYLISEISKKRPKEVPGKYRWRRLQMLYKVSKDGQIVDEFVFDEASHIKSAGWMRYPWKWPYYDGAVYVDLRGNFFIVSWGMGKKSNNTKVMVRRWGQNK